MVEKLTFIRSKGKLNRDNYNVRVANAKSTNLKLETKDTKLHPK